MYTTVAEKETDDTKRMNIIRNNKADGMRFGSGKQRKFEFEQQTTMQNIAQKKTSISPLFCIEIEHA